MYIAIAAPIATNDLLVGLDPATLRTFPKGRAEAPLVSHLIQELLRQGHRVLAITTDRMLDDDEPPFVYEQGNLTYVVAPSRQRIFRLNGKRLGRTADFFRVERKHILNILRQYKPDVVHGHWTYEFAMAAMAYDPNSLITIHDNARLILKYIPTLERLFMLGMARYVFHKGRRFTAVSPYTARSVQPWTSARIQVVPNPVVMPVLDEVIKPNHPVITMAANGWAKHKNLEIALLAFKQVQQRHPDAVLWAYGTAFEPGKQADDFCRKHAIPNVRLFGLTPHQTMLQGIAQSNLVLHTSVEESFGMVPAEAMACGIPVVAGQLSAVPWVVGEGGLLVDVTDPTAIAAAVDRLLTDPALAQSLGQKARASIASRFDLKKVTDQYLALYEQSLSTRAVPEAV
ncbi:glycosyltransferase family 4 protein [Spirosoma rhododendri]|uniref:Glycosyltransferase family 4 protein n=1 Tax=Spirosoma rhododendri TaxID=2728024 RepID=A0A7L5DT56_9BACT|nr:glycosyltransferase family 4 protein [Spirosoma rhododendri]QJD80463.1 glycosyltransferase family 4 protein [Spirosoma rhododendri]